MRIISRNILCVFAVVMLLTACSHKKSSVLEVIPADFELLVNIRVDKLTEEAGGSLNGVLSEGQLDILSQLEDALYLDNVVVALEDYDGVGDLERGEAANVTVAALVKDEKILENKLGKPKSKNGYEVYLSDGHAIAVKDGIAYAVSAANLSSDLKRIDENLEECDDEGAMYAIKAVTEAFAKPEDVVTVAMLNNGKKDAPKGQKNRTVSIGKFKFSSKSTIDFTGYAVYADGSVYTPVPQLAEISADALRYAGASPVFTVAVGIPEGFGWKKAFEQYNDAVEEVNAKYVISDTDILKLLPVLNNIEGTVMISVSVPGDITNLTSSLPDFVLLVQAKPGTERMLLSMLKLGIKQEMNIDLNINEDLTPALTDFRGITFYAGAVDGNVIISSRVPAKADNNLVKALSGKQMGMMLDIPSLGNVIPALDTRISMTVTSDGKTCSGSLVCADKPIMQVVEDVLSMMM